MATKSIYKDIRVKDKAFGRSLANALESAKSNKGRKVTFQRTPIQVSKDEIRGFFGKDNK